jgi:hypothetical protein
VVSGLTRISSVSRPGQSEVVLEFNWDTDMDLAVLDVREKLDFVELPRDAEKSVILRFDPSRDPIMRVRLQGLSDLRVLRFFAEKELKKEGGHPEQGPPEGRKPRDARAHQEDQETSDTPQGRQGHPSQGNPQAGCHQGAITSSPIHPRASCAPPG